MTSDEFWSPLKKMLMDDDPPEVEERMCEECQRVLDDLMKMYEEKRVAADEEKMRRLLDDLMKE